MAVIAVVLFTLGTVACTKREHYIEPAILTKGSAAPIVSGGWRKMGEFLSVKCVPTYLFTLGDKAYFSVQGPSILASTFWQYDPATNEFTPKATLPGNEQTKLPIFRLKVAMGINGKGYAGFFWTDGATYTVTGKTPIWEYDPAGDHWTQKSNLFNDGWYAPAVFTLGNKAYGCGWSTDDGYRNDKSYSYDPASDQWTNLNSSVPGNSYATSSEAFALNGKGYTVNINLSLDSIQTCEFDPATNQWQKITGFPVQYAPVDMPKRFNCPSYTIGGNAYVYVSGTTVNTNVTSNSIYQFSGTTKQWTKMPDFGGPTRIFLAAFSIGNKAYIGFGSDRGTDYCDLWEYNP